jgi:uncharacterized protein (TIGR03790 family)
LSFPRKQFVIPAQAICHSREGGNPDCRVCCAHQFSEKCELKTMIRIGVVSLLMFMCCAAAFALEPNEILVIANKDIAASGQIARYYCGKRNVPAKNILSLSLGATLNDTISRDDYEKRLAGPIRKELLTARPPGQIRCLLTTYGVPVKVGPRGTLIGMEGKLKELKELAKQEKSKLDQLKSAKGGAASPEYQEISRRLEQMQMKIDYISGKETNASVDSELSMVLFGPYELYR